MTMKHTPAPWVQGIEGEHNANIIYAGREGIADVYGIPMHQNMSEVAPRWAEGMANARLIAAAPDLLEALKHIVRITDRDHMYWDAARAAIKRATEG